MTVSWSRYAQSLTRRPIKGMLTGTITMLQWSFVRDDQAHQLTAQKIALALRDEVVDLEKARKVISDSRLWVNPDCGLKTRGWPETIEALKRMVAAAKVLRESAVEVV